MLNLTVILVVEVSTGEFFSFRSMSGFAPAGQLEGVVGFVLQVRWRSLTYLHKPVKKSFENKRKRN